MESNVNRGIVLISGLPGSGRSHLARGMSEKLQETQSIDFISVGERIRKIGQGALYSSKAAEIIEHLNSSSKNLLLEDELIFHATSEAMQEKRDTEILLVDGYPRRFSQVFDLQTLAVYENRRILGMIITETDELTEIERLIRRRYERGEGANQMPTRESRASDIDYAIESLRYNRDHIRPVHIDFPLRTSLDVQHVDTTKPKPEVISLGLQALARMTYK